MPHLLPASYELPFQSQSPTSRDAAVEAKKFSGKQSASVLAWFQERGACGGTQKECAAALNLGRPSVCARVNHLEHVGLLIKSVSERRHRCSVYFVTER